MEKSAHAVVISDIQVQKRNKTRLNIYVDGEFYCAMPAITAVENRVKQGAVFEREALDEIVRQGNIEQAFCKAAAYLARFLKTEKEMRIKLKEYDCDEAAQDVVVHKLKDCGLLNDYEFCRAYITSHMASQGAVRLKYDLRQRGVDTATIDALLDELVPTQDEHERAQAVADKYMRGKTPDVKTMRKLNAFLYARGFGQDTIRSVVCAFHDVDEH